MPRLARRRSGRRARLLDEAAIREFLATSYPKLVAAVALIEGSRIAAEDAVQESLARAWERSERGLEIENLDAWITRVAMNISKSRLRRMRAEARAGSRVGSPGDAGDPSVARIDVERALAALPRRQRQATVLRYYLGLDVEEIAAALGVREGTAKTTLFRARRALAAALGDHDSEEANDPARFG
jgi:RNA polymerase sigma-70 factor, ECF subfamily